MKSSKMGRPRSEEPMEGINVAAPRALKRALRAESSVRGSDLSPFCRMLLEYAWDVYLQMGWEKFERLRRHRNEERLKKEA
jgi:hypothetical protein